MRVVSDPVAFFALFNHVAYYDNFYSSAPLLDKVAEGHGICKKHKRFPDSLKKVHPPRVSETVGCNTFKGSMLCDKCVSGYPGTDTTA